MKKTKTITHIFLIAAVIAMLAVSVYAADMLYVKSLLSAGSETYSDYSQVKKAMRQAGFKMDIQERFDTGYAFELIRVQNTDALDESGSKMFSYKDLSAQYRNEDGKRLVLFGTPDLEELPKTPHADGVTREIGGITVTFWQDHYKMVPEDYELTEEDKVWVEQPGNFLSYGSDQMEETAVGFLNWMKDGIRYNFMDPRGAEQPEILFAMAEELILAK